MSVQLDRLERDTYRSVFADGLVDVAIGAFVLSIGVARMTDLDILPGLVGALAAPTWMLLRRYVVEPRAGTATLGSRRVAGLRRRIGMLSVVLVLLLVAALWLLAQAGADPATLPSGGILLPLGLGALLAVGSALFDFPRGFGYAVALPAARFLGGWAGLPRGVELIALGIAIVMVGLGLLVRFLRENPRLQPETGRAG